MAPMSMELHCAHCTALLQDETTREILEELDRERTRRAELEAQLRTLIEEKQLDEERTRQEDSETMTISRKHYMALQTELKGYRDLIDAMTKERPAISAALQASTRQRILPKGGSIPNTPSTPSLPLHVIRLLEIMPWDPRAKEYAFAKEEVYEWQFYDRKQQSWKTELRTSPQVFKELPVVDSTAGVNAVSDGSTNNRPLLAFFNQDSAPPSSCVLTNQSMTKLYNLQKGYPLPDNGGTWQWVGGWRVEKRISLNQDLSSDQSNNGRVVDCDDEGWSYAMEASHFVHLDPAEVCWDHAGTDSDGKVIRPVRRRKWTRQRALVDYPHASEQTKCFLSLMAQHMYATIAANKVSEQLVHTKVALTMVESALLQCKDESARQLHMLAELLKNKKSSKVTNPDDAKAIVLAVSEAAEEIQRLALQALRANSAAIPSSA